MCYISFWNQYIDDPHSPHPWMEVQVSTRNTRGGTGKWQERRIAGTHNKVIWSCLLKLTELMFQIYYTLIIIDRMVFLPLARRWLHESKIIDINRLRFVQPQKSFKVSQTSQLTWAWPLSEGWALFFDLYLRDERGRGKAKPTLLLRISIFGHLGSMRLSDNLTGVCPSPPTDA